MSADAATPGGVGAIFQWYLHSAITDGVRPPRAIGLGPRTSDAIERVADHHPEAEAGLIADAYDAFAQEHRGEAIPPVDRGEHVPLSPARRGVARRKGARAR